MGSLVHRPLAELYVSRLRGSDQMRQREAETTTAHDARVRAGWESPELRPAGGAIEFPREMLTYSDARTRRAPDPFEEVRPIDSLFQLLIDESYKCIGTANLIWRGAEGYVTTSVFTTKRYVVECDGNCGGVSYRVGRAGGYHHGQALFYPVVEFRTNLIVATDLQWNFVRTNANGEPPRVRIHTWTNGFDYGPRCQID
jgi:hypothetical protein